MSKEKLALKLHNSEESWEHLIFKSVPEIIKHFH